MKALRTLSIGFLIALTSTLIVLGALSLTLTEGQFTAYPQPQPTLPPPNLTPLPQQTQLIGAATPTNTPYYIAPPPTTCPPPAGWVSYLIQPDDTLTNLALSRNLTAEQILNANCLVSETLLPGTFLFLPEPILPPSATPLPIPTYTQQPCGPPFGWILYTVQPGQTLFGLSLEFGVSVYQLQRANCLSGTFIYAGQPLYVPNLPTRTATRPANTPTQPITPPATSTTPPTTTPTTADSPTPSITATDTPTSTPTITLTPEPTLTSTPEPTATP